MYVSECQVADCDHAITVPGKGDARNEAKRHASETGHLVRCLAVYGAWRNAPVYIGDERLETETRDRLIDYIARYGGLRFSDAEAAEEAVENQRTGGGN